MSEPAKSKEYFLDWIRFIAVGLVAYCHMVCGPITKFGLGDHISGDIYHSPLYWIYRIEIFFNHRGTSSGAVGVTLFFLLAGYLTAMTRSKYNTKQYLVRRAARLYPGVIISVIAVVIVSFLVNGTKPDVWKMIASCIILYPTMQLPSLIQIMWTLVVEVMFTIFMAFVPRVDFKKIVATELIVIFFVVAQAVNYTGAYSFWEYGKYVPILFVGYMIYFAIHDSSLLRWGQAAVVAALAYIELYISVYNTYTEESPYLKATTYISAMLICVLVYFVCKYVKIFNAANVVLNFVVSISYVFYLIQCDIGLKFMELIMKTVYNPYLIILFGLLVTILLSAFLYYCIEKPVQKLLGKLIKNIK